MKYSTDQQIADSEIHTALQRAKQVWPKYKTKLEPLCITLFSLVHISANFSIIFNLWSLIYWFYFHWYISFTFESYIMNIDWFDWCQFQTWHIWNFPIISHFLVMAQKCCNFKNLQVATDRRGRPKVFPPLSPIPNCKYPQFTFMYLFSSLHQTKDKSDQVTTIWIVCDHHNCHHNLIAPISHTIVFFTYTFSTQIS